jgi:hypothetical protein
MALVIVEKGTKHDNQKWVGSCRKCGSKAEGVRSDITNYNYDPRQNYEFSWEKCPECGTGGSSGYGGLLMHPVK